MAQFCPECDGANVRRRSTPVAERTWRNSFYSRYRCRDCSNEFWAIRRKTYAACVTLLAVLVLTIIGAYVTDRMFNPLNSDDRSEDAIGSHASLTEGFKS